MHDDVGYNYRMPNLNAAIGCAQLENLPSILDRKRILYKRYLESFKDNIIVRLLGEPNDCSSNFWLQTLVLNKGYDYLWEDILGESNRQGIQTRPAWAPLHELPPYDKMFRSPLVETESIARRVINIPSNI